MLVKKLKQSWFPSEKKDMKVGDTIEITDPRALIMSGDAIGVSDSGEELSAYELYGVLLKDERKEFEDYLAMKKASAIKEQLESEREALRKQLAKELEKPATAKPVVEEEKPVVEKKK